MKTFIVDSFTNKAFRGNPAGVCLVEQRLANQPCCASQELLEISDTDILAQLTPDFAALHKSHNALNGVLVTAPSGLDGFDFHSRYFWPWSGANEDPVTGGTHTFLAKYWSVRLGKTKMRSFQSSRRSGFMEVELVDGQVVITSQAVIVLEGKLLV